MFGKFSFDSWNIFSGAIFYDKGKCGHKSHIIPPIHGCTHLVSLRMTCKQNRRDALTSLYNKKLVRENIYRLRVELRVEKCKKYRYKRNVPQHLSLSYETTSFFSCIISSFHKSDLLSSRYFHLPFFIYLIPVLHSLIPFFLCPSTIVIFLSHSKSFTVSLSFSYSSIRFLSSFTIFYRVLRIKGVPK